MITVLNTELYLKGRAGCGSGKHRGRKGPEKVREWVLPLKGGQAWMRFPGAIDPHSVSVDRET